MNFEEIIEKLKNINESVEEWAYGDFPGELGTTKEVFSKGGEGEGESWERVYHFVDHNIFISFSGFYSSYNGTDFEGWDDVCEVTPKEKLVTVYE